MLNLRLDIPYESLQCIETGRRLCFYLAAEEYVARNAEKIIPEDQAAGFLWKVPPTVIYGRNQDPEAEINTDYCNSSGIDMQRRKSGGGCVYADAGNIMISAISRSAAVEDVFSQFLCRVRDALRSAGVDAEVSGRNDILAGGGKVSGNAFFMTPNAGIVHGTMLFNTDFEAMEKALNPSKSKLRGVSSVRSRVKNISEILPDWSIERFGMHLHSELFSEGVITLGAAAIKEIEALAETYRDKAFLEGRQGKGAREADFRLDGSGQYSVKLDLEGGTIRRVAIDGDYFVIAEGAEAELNRRLQGVIDSEIDVSEALEGFYLNDYFKNIDTKTFIQNLYSNV